MIGLWILNNIGHSLEGSGGPLTIEHVFESHRAIWAPADSSIAIKTSTVPLKLCATEAENTCFYSDLTFVSAANFGLLIAIYCYFTWGTHLLWHLSYFKCILILKFWESYLHCYYNHAQIEVQHSLLFTSVDFYLCLSSWASACGTSWGVIYMFLCFLIFFLHITSLCRCLIWSVIRLDIYV